MPLRSFILAGLFLPLISCGVTTKPLELFNAGLDSEHHPSGEGWELVWHDEFNEGQLDRSKWEPEISCWGGGNNEKQCYTDRPENIIVENGVLKLRAQPEEFEGPEFPQGYELQGHETQGRSLKKPFTSGKVRTRGRASWRYGRISARMKLPKGQSTWPAFWMLPAENLYGGWPLSGEIDIMEAVNLGARCDDCNASTQEIHTSGALHFGDKWPNNTFVSQKKPLANIDALDEFHEFSLEWKEGQMRWFVDGEMFFTATQDDWHAPSASADSDPNAPFDQAFYLMLNLAVGGNYPDNFNEKQFNPASFPSELWVDWVRVYACADNEETRSKCM